MIDKGKYKDSSIIKGNEVDLINLVKTLWIRRQVIYYSIITTVIIGILIAFMSSEKYYSSVTLLPTVEKKSNNISGLNAIAGMAGINLNSMMGESTGIPAEVYPQVVESYSFKRMIINSEYHIQNYDKPISLYEYAIADSIESLLDKIGKYTIFLPWTIKGALTKNSSIEKKSENYGVIILSDEELEVLKRYKDLIVVDVEENTGLITISSELNEPILVAQVVKKAVELLQEYVINYKTKQAREHLSFIQGQFDIKKLEYENAQQAFFEYKDQHRNIISERMNLEFQRLSDEYDMTSNVFKGIAQQLEQAKIAVSEQTPVFSILEPAKVPKERSSPKRKIILVVSLFLGGLIGIILILSEIIISNFKERMKYDLKS